jgi:outer membrane protein assembly factor BamB
MPKRDAGLALAFCGLFSLITGCTFQQNSTNSGQGDGMAMPTRNLVGLESEMAQVAQKRAWSDHYFKNSVVHNAVVDGNDLLVSVFQGAERAFELHCIDATTGVNRWMLGGLPAPFEFAPTMGEEYVVGLFGGGHGMVVARRRNGARPFSLTTPFNQVPTASPASSDSTVYVTSLVDDRLHALNPENGFSGWAVRANGTINAGPLMTPRLPRRLIVVGTSRGEVVAYPPSPWSENEPAEPAWRRELFGEVSGEMSIAKRLTEDGIEVSILVPCGDKGLYCLDAATGEPRWVHRTDQPFTGRPVAFGDRVYARNKTRFFVLDLSTGDPVWEMGTEGNLRAYEESQSALAGDHQRAYLLDGKKRVTRVRGADGTKEASTSLNGFDFILRGGDSNLLIGLTKDGHIVAFH